MRGAADLLDNGYLVLASEADGQVREVGLVLDYQEKQVRH
jgi:hypothetical protein